MKLEWRKDQKELYGTAKQPKIVQVPPQQFIMIDGVGDPNLKDFSDRVGALYSVAYPLKMVYKKQAHNELTDFSVFPLEGLWSSENPEDVNDKSSFVYTLMIQQPKVITETFFSEILTQVKSQKKLPLLNEIYFKTLPGELAGQILHVGSFDDEPKTFAKLTDFIATEGYQRKGQIHREIYLNDARKTAPEKRKTILRYQIEESS